MGARRIGMSRAVEKRDFSTRKVVSDPKFRRLAVLTCRRAAGHVLRSSLLRIREA